MIALGAPAAGAATGDRLLGVVSEPYAASGGRQIDPLPHDGLNAWVSTVRRFQSASGARLTIVMRYRDWGASLANLDDRRLMRLGYDPMLTIEPTSSMPIAAIAAGKGDAKLTLRVRALQRALVAASAHRDEPITAYIRFAHEMNGTWYAWGAPGQHPSRAALTKAQATYRKAFRRVAAIVHREAPNVQMVWAANRMSIPAIPANDMTRWYPGDDAVDWIGVDGYNRDRTRWHTPKELFEPFRAIWSRSMTRMGGDPLSRHRGGSRPLMIAETSTIDAGAGGSATRTDAAWIRSLAAYLHRHDEFRAVIWFDRAKRCSDYSTSISCRVVNWNPTDGTRAKTLPWDWNSSKRGAAAFKALAQDASLFAGPTG